MYTEQKDEQAIAMSSSTSKRQLRVLHFICPTGFYGAEKWILSLVNNIDDESVVSELAVIREEGDPTLKLVSEFRQLDLTAHEIKASGRFDLKIVGKLVKLLRNRRIDVLHTHGYKPDILGVIAARRARVRTVCTTHGFENTKDTKLRFYIWAGCQSYRFFDKVVSLTEDLRATVHRYGTRQKRTQVIKSGIDLKPFESYIQRREPGHYHHSGRLIIGFIGQMITRKNIHGLIGVFDGLARENPNLSIELQLLGDGIDREKFEAYATTLSSRDHIKFLGFVDNPLDYLEEFDLFLMTSTLEGTPLCLMEAMAMGVPAAAYDIDGVDLLVKQNETGLLAEQGDCAGLVGHCTKLLSDPEFARRMATAARKRVLEQFSAERMARDYLEVYQSVASLPK